MHVNVASNTTTTTVTVADPSSNYIPNIIIHGAVVQERPLTSSKLYMVQLFRPGYRTTTVGETTDQFNVIHGEVV
jgi:hypothetical protein